MGSLRSLMISAGILAALVTGIAPLASAKDTPDLPSPPLVAKRAHTPVPMLPSAADHQKQDMRENLSAVNRSSER
jgi:hypothetical protein